MFTNQSRKLKTYYRIFGKTSDMEVMKAVDVFEEEFVDGLVGASIYNTVDDALDNVVRLNKKYPDMGFDIL